MVLTAGQLRKLKLYIECPIDGEEILLECFEFGKQSFVFHQQGSKNRWFDEVILANYTTLDNIKGICGSHGYNILGTNL